MRSLPRFQEKFPITGNVASLTTGWSAWIQDVFDALRGWNSSASGKATLDFGTVPMQSQISLPATVSGAAVGDAVIVSPSADASGIIFVGVVTAKDTVTIYAKNFTSDLVDPPAIDFRIILLQN